LPSDSLKGMRGGHADSHSSGTVYISVRARWFEQPSFYFAQNDNKHFLPVRLWIVYEAVADCETGVQMSWSDWRAALQMSRDALKSIIKESGELCAIIFSTTLIKALSAIVLDSGWCCFSQSFSL